MQGFSSKEIKGLHGQFMSSTYVGRLQLYYAQLGFDTFDFPKFDGSLYILIEETGLGILQNFYKEERKKSFPLIKRIHFKNDKYVFNITPPSNCCDELNTYLINTFIEKEKGFKDLQKKINGGFYKSNQVIAMLNQTAAALETVKYIIEDKKKASINKQFMNVFYSGFQDYHFGKRKKADRKKMHLEIYLYVQGYLIGQYMEALQMQVNLLKPPAASSKILQIK